MTPADSTDQSLIAALEGAWGKATKGEWEAHDESLWVGARMLMCGAYGLEENAALIVLLHNSLPRLIELAKEALASRAVSKEARMDSESHDTWTMAHYDAEIAALKARLAIAEKANKEQKRLRKALKAIDEYGDMIGTCRLCEEDIDGTGRGQVHLPECPFEWARDASRRASKEKAK